VLRKNVKDVMYGSVIRVLLPCDKTKICHVIDKTGFPTPQGCATFSIRRHLQDVLLIIEVGQAMSNPLLLSVND